MHAKDASRSDTHPDERGSERTGAGDEIVTAARQPCVLVAEDEDMVRDLAARVLRSQGMRVITARHGGEAVAAFLSQASEIDAVLLDLTMPVMHGSEVLAAMKRAHPGVRVLVTSGYSDSESVGADDVRVRFLQKPYRAQSLLASMQVLLAVSTSATPAS